VSRFRDRYYRPNFVEAVLRGQDIEEALRETRAPAKAPTQQLLPPVIRILSPSEGEAVSKSPVEIRYAVRSPSGDPVTAVDVKVDSRPVEQPARLSTTVLLAPMASARDAPRSRWAPMRRSP
jgi:hypothetical protein